MYQSYWGLSESPFRGGLDPRYFHQGLEQDEALARLQFLVDEHRTLGMLLGMSGSGKSMLLEVFARQLRPLDTQTALVNLSGLDEQEFLWQLSGQLGVEVSPHVSHFTLARTLVDHIRANRYQQVSTILLLDDADEARPEVIREIVRLTQIDVASDARTTIVLTAQPSRMARLGARLLDMAELRIDLDGWAVDETATFVKRALAVAGRSTPVFSEAALTRLHQQSAGNPRRAKQLADLALLAGAGQNLAQIEPDTIDSVIHELGVATSSGPILAIGPY